MIGWNILREQFIYLENLKFLEEKMTCLDEEIKNKLKLKNFKKLFQITKIV